MTRTPALVSALALALALGGCAAMSELGLGSGPSASDMPPVPASAQAPAAPDAGGAAAGEKEPSSPALEAPVFPAAPVFWASLNPGWARTGSIRLASLDPAVAFWLRKAARISAALARARQSIAFPITLFPDRFQGGIPICIA